VAKGEVISDVQTVGMLKVVAVEISSLAESVVAVVLEAVFVARGKLQCAAVN